MSVSQRKQGETELQKYKGKVKVKLSVCITYPSFVSKAWASLSDGTVGGP